MEFEGGEKRAWFGELIDGKVPEGLEEPDHSWWPIICAAGVALLFTALYIDLAFMAVGGLIILISIIGWGLEISDAKRP